MANKTFKYISLVFLVLILLQTVSCTAIAAPIDTAGTAKKADVDCYLGEDILQEREICAKH